jgi:hypothetical protein
VSGCGLGHIFFSDREIKISRTFCREVFFASFSLATILLAFVVVGNEVFALNSFTIGPSFSKYTFPPPQSFPESSLVAV